MQVILAEDEACYLVGYLQPLPKTHYQVFGADKITCLVEALRTSILFQLYLAKSFKLHKLLLSQRRLFDTLLAILFDIASIDMHHEVVSVCKLSSH